MGDEESQRNQVIIGEKHGIIALGRSFLSSTVAEVF